MKKILALLLVLMTMATLAACGKKDTEAKNDSTASANQTVNSEGLPVDGAQSQEKQKGNVIVDIIPPEGWERVEGSVLPVQYMKNTASFMVKNESFNNDTLDEVVNDALDIYKDTFDNLTVQGEVEPTTVDEKDARILTFTCNVSGMEMKYQYIYLFVADNTYVITFADLASTFDSSASDFEYILSNIHFTAE